MKGASATARLIAASIVLQDARGIAGDWVPATTIALSRATLQSGGRRARFFLAVLRRPWMAKLCGLLERWLLPGIQAHYLLRKHRIAEWAEDAVAARVEQVLVLGAGMDGLGAELSLHHPHLRVVEMDHLATQTLKRRALKEVAPASGVHLHAVDLAADPIEDALAACGLSRPAHFRGTLHLVLSAMESGEDGKPGFHRAHPLVDRWLRLRRESFRWGCEPAQLSGVLAHAGLRTLAIDRGEQPPCQELPGWSPCTGVTVRDDRATTAPA